MHSTHKIVSFSVKGLIYKYTLPLLANDVLGFGLDHKISKGTLIMINSI